MFVVEREIQYFYLNLNLLELTKCQGVSREIKLSKESSEEKLLHSKENISTDSSVCGKSYQIITHTSE